jgi:hypothetical protein
MWKYSIFLVLFLLACNEKPIAKKVVESFIVENPESLVGNWVNHDARSFTLIQIEKSTAKFICYDYDKKRENNFYFYESDAEIKMRDSVVTIITKNFRFYYMLRKDTLVELDKIRSDKRFYKQK